MIELPQSDSAVRHIHRRQAVRRHAQRHHWRFYNNRPDWSFVQSFAALPLRWGRERLVVAAVVALLATLGFVILPGFAAVAKPAPAPVALDAQAIALPRMAATESQTAPPTPEWKRVVVRSGQTLGAIFSTLGYPGSAMHEFLAASPDRHALTRLNPGDEIAFLPDAAGGLSGLRFDLDESTRVVLARDPAGAIETTTQARPLERRIRVASGRVEHSLFGAGEAAGLSDATILQLAETFAYDVDFAQDLRAGDSFSVVYEELYREGERVRGGGIVAARFVNQGRSYEAVRFDRADGNAGFFDATGRPLKKAFLRTPVEFTRISSRFSTARKHPILGVMRAHRGVDYAALAGTPIRAAGNGRVAFRGWKSGYGNVVILEHANKYSTLYGHMSRFGKYPQGAKVEQGEVIGFVGRTGLATAPHLHYEFRVSGVHRDPLSIALPKADPLVAGELQRFRQAVAPLFAQLDLLDGRTRQLASR
ncbi:MAG TPA: peptidoglycan DD-metalloendopeptidase family protein [Candidatus Saccharimonadia bacterium]|nr:peptidoglycan DD-metalloendopeptidase family protein [Candidatus Saccharimonadia bacterium]